MVCRIITCLLLLASTCAASIYEGNNVEIDISERATNIYETVFSLQSVNYTQNLNVQMEILFREGSIALSLSRDYSLLTYDLYALQGEHVLDLEEGKFYKLRAEMRIEQSIGASYVYSANVMVYEPADSLAEAKNGTTSAYHFQQKLNQSNQMYSLAAIKQVIANRRKTISCNYLSDIYMVLYAGWTKDADLKVLDVKYTDNGCEITNEGVAITPQSTGVMYYSSSNKILCF